MYIYIYVCIYIYTLAMSKDYHRASTLSHSKLDLIHGNQHSQQEVK